ncbi:hypothetical protein [Aegicerativicinus sediminis]|uniref:hypothetical protein n=1 Tax=Aegicerativicinus sediminis TaxID=2893202 RepID=UPI001E41913E|nr:hypothetical protein [Aegicerativicinus sediminis]
MNNLLAIVLLFFSSLGYSQINSSYKTIQKNFGDNNLIANKTSDNHYQFKTLGASETIKFKFDKESLVRMIEVESEGSIDNARFHELAKELNPKFKLTSTGSTDYLNLFYDSKNELLNIKIFETAKKVKLKKIIFISDTNLISEMIPDIKNWK